MRPHLRFHDIGRLKEILKVLGEEGFYYLLHDTKLKFHLPLFKRYSKERREDEPVRLRKALERLGPVFIKFGQWMSLRPDVLPKEYIDELEKLQQSVKPFSYNEAKKVIESELKTSLNSMFKSFSRKPIASASLSQVHSAYLKNGKRVAIKVQRPGIKDEVQKDMDILYFIAHSLEKSHFSKFKPTQLIIDFAEWTSREMDFKVEGRASDIFRENFKNDKNVSFPRVYWDYVTSKVLVMEYFEGKSVKEIKTSKNVVVKIYETFFKMVYLNGMFHADPHSGNVFVHNNKIIFTDLGMFGFLTKDIRKNLQKWIFSLLNKDFGKVADYMVAVSDTSPASNIENFKKEALEITYSSYDPIISHADMKKSFFELINAATRNRVYPKKEIVLFIRSISIIEGLGLSLYPDLKFDKDLLPIIKRIMLRNKTGEYKDLALQYSEFLKEVPVASKKLLKKLENGKIGFEVEHKELENFEMVLDRASINVSMGFIIAGLFVTSALTMRYEIMGIKIISPILLISGFILLIWVLIRIRNIRKITRKMWR